MAKRILYLEDLYDFYSNTYKRSTHFSSEKSGEPLVVHVKGIVNFSAENKDAEGLCPVHLQACHTNLNLNGSNISESVMQEALPSFSNRPILAYIHKVDDQWEFYTHNMHEDENGETVYDEHPIGIIPESCNAQLVYDEEKKKTYCEVDGYIFEEYSKAADILKREEECAVSVELSVRSLSYNAKQKYLDIEDFFFSGVTILGKTPDGQTVNPGMANSNIKLADFSAKNNSLFEDYAAKMLELQERLEKLESTCFNNDNDQKGGEHLVKFEDLLKKYNVTAEQVTFNYEGLSDKELEQKFDETFGEESSEETGDEEGTETSDDSNVEPEQTATENESAEESEVQDGQFEKMTRIFEISHEDIRYALYNLLVPFEDSDNEWYFINSVYDTYFTYENWSGEKVYGQAYTKDGDNVAFDGERYNLHRELLTDSEYAELQSMRANYAELKKFKEDFEKNELHSKREEILNSEKYAVIAVKNENGEFANADFAELVKEMDKYSLEDLETKIKVIHSDYISEHSNFSSTENNTNKATSKKVFSIPGGKEVKTSRYGNLFSK